VAENIKSNEKYAMKINFFACLLIFVSLHCFSVKADETNTIKKQTFIYSIQGNDTLRLDKYSSPCATGDKPCLIFVFGGGFAAGTRDDADYLPFYGQLVNQGYAVIAIDYRLGLKNLPRNINMTEANPQISPQFISAFGNALTMAVEDFFDASRYVVEHAEEWKIDPKQIVSCGSSAGAITVLQGEYEACNHTPLAQHLPQGFKYAGVISFAGAIFTTNNELAWAEQPAPIQFFHGDGDREVPYGALKSGALSMYGSQPIAEKLSAIHSPYYFYSVKKAGHSLSTSPMKHNWCEITTFLDKFVAKGEHLIINTNVIPVD
jgi:predicted esterase